MESLEKDKDNERAVRSRLEEEYLKITKKHEDEVILKR
jgi:hypothetical protein